MSVEYSATLGYGLIVDAEDVVDPSEVGPWEILEQVLDAYPLITFEIGGGGYSSSDEQYALFIKSTTQTLTEIDGVYALDRPKIDTDALRQLEEAYTAATRRNSDWAPRWLVAGGFH